MIARFLGVDGGFPDLRLLPVRLPSDRPLPDALPRDARRKTGLRAGVLRRVVERVVGIERHERLLGLERFIRE